MTLKDRLEEKNYKKLEALKNPEVEKFIARYVEHCNPKTVFICNDTREDFQYIRKKTIKNKEEKKLKTRGHTIHYDNYHDQARDKKNTRILKPEGTQLSENVNTMERETGLKEIHEILKDIMKDREMYVLFGSLGPNNSPFSMPGIQLTDSAYVAHNEIMLFRPGYEEFKKLNNKRGFFKFVHSQGELDENKTSKNLEKRRVYIDVPGETVYSTNNQYGGNSLGFKKHAMRLAIARAHEDGSWLCEHMFIMSVKGPRGRKTYFTGAYPSACGKTSTAMVPGEQIVGDDITYFRVIDGEVRAANVEQGMFGIISNVNKKSDPSIFDALTTPGEVIFSNVLVDENNNARWNDDGRQEPEKGFNHSGEWYKGKKDKQGKEIPASHKNARYTIMIKDLKNRDQKADDPNGVPAGGLIYGGRDSDTLVPVEQAFSWEHGIVTKAATLESETTFATLGGEGRRAFSPMSNIDFLSIPLADYINDNLKFVEKAVKEPAIFSVNYFLRKDGNPKGKFLNDIEDKRVWLKWMELRVHDEVGAIKTPTGLIPKYEDLKRLFKEVLKKDYSKEDYDEQFTVRIPELLSKIERMKEIYGKVPNTPEILFKLLDEQKKRLETLKQEKGDHVKPKDL